MRILWLKTELLHPVDKGGKIRSYNILKGLQRDHTITYLCLDDGSAAADARDRAGEYCHALEMVPHTTVRRGSPRFFLELLRNLVSPLPYAVARWRSAALEERLRELAPGHDVVICDFLAPSPNVPDGLPVPTVLFQHNVEAQIWERHTRVAGGPVRRLYMRAQWRRMARLEKQEVRRHDHVIAVSGEDLEQMRDRYGVPDSRLDVVPTGVDTGFFQPDPKLDRDSRRVVFTGSMDWMPNQDGIEWFLDAIVPKIRQRVPDVRVDIVGRSPPARLVDRGEREEGLRVTGFVDDIRPYIQEAAVAVVPLRVGGGTRLKVYEAMAMETPVVSTTIGAEGLPLRDGEDLLIADEPDTFADTVAGLLEAPETARSLGRRAGARVRRHFGWDAVADRFGEVCARVAEP